MCRTVDIMADAAHLILTKPARDFTGNFCIDDSLLYDNGVREFDKYRVDPTKDLMPDFFVPDTPAAPVSLKAVK
jgi:citronellol/citronellal dehydrogenase